LYILAKDYFRTHLSRLYSISIFPPYLFCNPPVPTAREMFYAFSSRTNVLSESYGDREYRDSTEIPFYANVEFDLGMRVTRGIERREGMYANTGQLGIVVVLTRSLDSRSRSNWTNY